MSEITRYDDREIRCPKLGHELTFAYCRREGGELPCFRVIRCWEGFFPVESFLRESLSPDAWETFRRHTPPDKLTSLLDLIAKAQQRRGG
ncbi:MAG TPA: hypothetical protein PLU95_08460 [Syntrophales bacterium]|jgi:hypothetical protein|nr:hypothetical protein [Syntrophales bacterium]HOD98116.1 hypothetical protein [Syntrophales bacterium]HOH72792.1 hypothetical protein [Syntrophales bacterium]HPN09323.1 hypothetical protein [Syntrophales bacterium]HPX82231.1 hypothetical protein [Syntrophales bacterium]